jgi:hypothetical protein
MSSLLWRTEDRGGRVIHRYVRPPADSRIMMMKAAAQKIKHFFKAIVDQLESSRKRATPKIRARF